MNFNIINFNISKYCHGQQALTFNYTSFFRGISSLVKNDNDHSNTSIEIQNVMATNEWKIPII